MQICKIDVNMQTWYLKINKHMLNKYRYMPTIYKMIEKLGLDRRQNKIQYRVEG